MNFDLDDLDSLLSAPPAKATEADAGVDWTMGVCPEPSQPPYPEHSRWFVGGVGMGGEDEGASEEEEDDAPQVDPSESTGGLTASHL
jgi:hypothetical protein